MRLRTGIRIIIGIAVAVLAFAGLAGVAQAATSGGTVMTTHSTVDHPAAHTVSAAAACNTFNRTSLCYTERAVVVVLVNRTPVGTATFVITHKIQLSTRSRNFSEQVSLSGLHLVGNAGGIHVALGIRCDSPCTVTGNNFPVGHTLSNGLHGTLTFRDSVAKGRAHSDRTTYMWLFVKAGATPADLTTHTALTYRCDFAVGPVAGCVFPAFAPVLTSMTRLPHIAANIRRIQSHGGHYGRQGSGHPLHRITNKKQINSNRNFICPRNLRRPPGKSCDEYPFATTREGGNGVPANSRGRAFVPNREQNQQGGLISSFYQGNRVLAGDPFWVKV